MIAPPIIEAKINILTNTPTNGKVHHFTLPKPAVEVAEVNAYPYGWRTVIETAPNGKEIYRDIPLTAEDFLNPQLGDSMPQDPEHAKIAIAIYDRLEKQVKNQPQTELFFDTKMVWHIPGLQEPFPDVSVVPNVKDRAAIGGTFDCLEQGTRPCLIVEVMSPNYQGDDTKKVEIYEQAGVAEYIILNPHLENRSLPMVLTGYRLVGKRYQPIQPDATGQLLSQTVGVKFGLDKTGRALILTDALTGQKLLTNEEELAARLEAEARAQAEALAREEELAARLEAEARVAMLEARLRELGFNE